VEFRWVALITLWTFLSGPILGVPSKSSAAKPGKATLKVVKRVAPFSWRR
jgi:hypothetical protein